MPGTKVAAGLATLGIFKRNKDSGEVFTAATTDWSLGLEQEDISQITKNIINKFSK